MRLAAKAHRRNKAVKSQVTSQRRKFFDAVAAKDKEKSRRLFREYCSVLDKAAKKGMIAQNTATRRKRRAAAQVAALG